MDKRLLKFFLLPAIMLVTTLACTINIGGPVFPTPPIPVSTEAVGELQSNIQTAVAAGSNTGEITLVFTEPELTSYLFYYLQKQSHPLITSPQVYLQENEIRIYGTAIQGNFQANVKIVISAGVDVQGQLSIELVSADFGPFPVPGGLKEMITSIIKEAYTGSLGPVATGFRLESISIAAGTMVMTGNIK